MKKEGYVYLFVVCAAMVIIGFFMNSMFNSASEESMPTTEPVEPTEITGEVEQELSLYVVIDKLHGYTSGVDSVNPDGTIKSEDVYDFVVNRETRQVFMYTKHYVGSVGHRYEVELIPLEDGNGNAVFYDGELPGAPAEEKPPENEEKPDEKPNEGTSDNTNEENTDKENTEVIVR